MPETLPPDVLMAPGYELLRELFAEPVNDRLGLDLSRRLKAYNREWIRDLLGARRGASGTEDWPRAREVAARHIGYGLGRTDGERAEAGGPETLREALASAAELFGLAELERHKEEPTLALALERYAEGWLDGVAMGAATEDGDLNAVFEQTLIGSQEILGRADREGIEAVTTDLEARLLRLEESDLPPRVDHQTREVIERWSGERLRRFLEDRLVYRVWCDTAETLAESRIDRALRTEAVARGSERSVGHLLDTRRQALELRAGSRSGSPDQAGLVAAERRALLRAARARIGASRLVQIERSRALASRGDQESPAPGFGAHRM